MLWNEFAIRENMKLWKREQNDPEALWLIDDGPLVWYSILTEALSEARAKHIALPPIYFPSPRQCNQFIDFVNKAK